MLEQAISQREMNLPEETIAVEAVGQLKQVGVTPDQVIVASGFPALIPESKSPRGNPI